MKGFIDKEEPDDATRSTKGPNARGNRGRSRFAGLPAANFDASTPAMARHCGAVHDSADFIAFEGTHLKGSTRVDC